MSEVEIKGVTAINKDTGEQQNFTCISINGEEAVLDFEDSKKIAMAMLECIKQTFT